MMALTTSRVQYLAARAKKDGFWMRDKNCCAVSFSNLTTEKSTRIRNNNSDLKPNNPNNGRKNKSDSKYAITVKERHILKLLVNELKVKEQVIWNEIVKHPKRKFLTMDQIQKSLKFLHHLGYSRQMIADLPAICFYPQGNIETGLEEITRNAVELYKMGYVNGVLKDETPGFLCGSKLKDKRLQLCLYYMELPFDFNGNGIFSLDESSDSYSSETK